MAQAGEHLVPAILGTSPRHGADCFQHRLGQGLTASLTPGYCWRIYFKVREVLFLASVSQAFLPSKQACGGH